VSVLVPREQCHTSLVPDVGRDTESGNLYREQQGGPLFIQVHGDLNVLSLLISLSIFALFVLVDPFKICSRQVAGEAFAELDPLVLFGVGRSLNGESIDNET
jgi:hypothetical protein